MGSNPTPPKLNSNIKFENIVGRCKNLSAFSLQANRELADRKNLDYVGIENEKVEHSKSEFKYKLWLWYEEKTGFLLYLYATSNPSSA